ncbi:MAG: hypothetical protein R3F50_04250 [Gammaproteobacteria bacterium]
MTITLYLSLQGVAFRPSYWIRCLALSGRRIPAAIHLANGFV